MDNIKVSETVVSQVPRLGDKLSELVRYASLSLLIAHADSQDVQIRAMDSGFKPGKILASNMIFILVSGDALRLTFKVHFETRTAKRLAVRIFDQSSAANISEKHAIDYFKEYANLVAGRVVALSEKLELELGISLPLCTRGFYEVFSDYSEKLHPIVTFSDFWKLQISDNEIFCSAQFEILNKKKLDNLVDYEIVHGAADDSEEMEFL